jgi:hypothetical protein
LLLEWLCHRGSRRQACFFTVQAKQIQNEFRMLSKVHQSLVDRRDQLAKLGEVLVVRCALLELAPQVLDRVVVRRIRRQLIDGDALAMLGPELLHRFAGVIPGAILDDE